MEFFEDDYILGVWQSEKIGVGHFLLTVKRGKESDEWIGEYRLRYYRDDKIFNSEDYKLRYTIKAKDSENNVQTKMNEFFNFMCVQYPDNPSFTEVKGDVKKMMRLLQNLHWFHAKVQDREGNIRDIKENEFEDSQQ